MLSKIINNLLKISDKKIYYSLITTIVINSLIFSNYIPNFNFRISFDIICIIQCILISIQINK